MKKIIGYIDEHGYVYCQKHASSQMDSITQDDEFGVCEVCGEDIGRKSIEYIEEEMKQYDGI